MALSYDQWMRQATQSESIPPNSDGLLHVGERAALVEQLSYLKKRNAQLMKQQRAVLLAACEAQAAHAQCADFAGELMRAQMDQTPRETEDVGEKLSRLEHENAELLRKTAVLVDYVRATAPMPRTHHGGSYEDDEYSDDDDDDDDVDNDNKDLPPKRVAHLKVSCLPAPTGFDHFASRHARECKWDSFYNGILSAFGGGLWGYHASNAIDE